MTAADVGDPETVLADLELTGRLTIQMTALGTLGLVVAVAGLGVESLTVGAPGTITHLFAFVNSPTEIPPSVAPGVLGVAAAIGVTYASVRSHRRGGRPVEEV